MTPVANGSLFDQTVEYVNTSFKGKQVPHFERTVYWFEKFYPATTEAHRIAAYSHDIERAFRDETTNVPNDYLDQSFLKYHQEKGADIMADFLKGKSADEDLINKVKYLIGKHEIGGDEQQNALMNADSVSFFETNAEMFVKKKAPVEGYEKVKEKLDWMFNRISSPEAKEEARANYEKWIASLKKSFE